MPYLGFRLNHKHFDDYNILEELKYLHIQSNVLVKCSNHVKSALLDVVFTFIDRLRVAYNKCFKRFLKLRTRSRASHEFASNNVIKL